MGVADGLDPQDRVALLPRCPRDIPERFVAVQSHAQNLARTHALKPEFGSHECHRADLAGNVDVMVRLYSYWLYGHVPNYTANGCRCKLFQHA